LNLDFLVYLQFLSGGGRGSRNFQVNSLVSGIFGAVNLIFCYFRNRPPNFESTHFSKS